MKIGKVVTVNYNFFKADMEKKNKQFSKVPNDDDGLHGINDNSVVHADIQMMKDVVNQFKADMDHNSEDDDGVILVFHVAIIWPTALVSLYPSIKVIVKLKEEEDDHEVVSWERVIHNSQKRGWENTLALIMHAVRDLKLDYIIMENIDSQERYPGWIQ